MGLLSELMGVVINAVEAEKRAMQRAVVGLVMRGVMLKTCFMLLLAALGLMVTAIYLALYPCIGCIGALFICAGILLALSGGLLAAALVKR